MRGDNITDKCRIISYGFRGKEKSVKKFEKQRLHNAINSIGNPSKTATAN